MPGQLFIGIFWRKVRIAFRQETTLSRDVMNSWQATLSVHLLGDIGNVLSRKTTTRELSM
jgi:hypothetical protein